MNARAATRQDRGPAALMCQLCPRITKHVFTREVHDERVDLLGEMRLSPMGHDHYKCTHCDTERRWG